MLSHPSRLFFLSTVILGAGLAVSANSWFTAWMGLELNLLSFIPLLTSYKNIYETEAALKYFLIQAMASAVILLSALVLLVSPSISPSIAAAALFLKMGAAPLHFWLPTVMQGAGWPQCFILMTVQKIAPLSLLSYTLTSANSTGLLVMVSMLSAMIGALGGLNQTFTRKIMAYSSINHLSWMLAGLFVSKSLFAHYFLVYTLITLSVTAIFYSKQIFHIFQIPKVTAHNSTLKMALTFSMMSLGGLPPFLGFIPKLLIIQALGTANQIIWLAPLLMSALITLFFYIRLTLTISTLSSLNLAAPTKTYSNLTSVSVSFVNLVPLAAPFMLLIPY